MEPRENDSVEGVLDRSWGLQKTDAPNLGDPERTLGARAGEVVQIPRRHFPLAPQIASPWGDWTGS